VNLAAALTYHGSIEVYGRALDFVSYAMPLLVDTIEAHSSYKFCHDSCPFKVFPHRSKNLSTAPAGDISARTCLTMSALPSNCGRQSQMRRTVMESGPISYGPGV
jgi:hypothetical protein